MRREWVKVNKSWLIKIDKSQRLPARVNWAELPLRQVRHGPHQIFNKMTSVSHQN